MSDVIKHLGLNPEEVKWYHLAACSNMHINNFYDYYENDQRVARQIDEMCLVCPVAKKCLQEGMKNKEYGVWGGIYLHLGKADKQNNTHKTQEIWKRLQRLHGKRSIS
jgi:hypothetical protein